MIEDEYRERAEEAIYRAIDADVIWHGLMDNGMDTDDADRILCLVEAAYIDISWPDNV